MMKIGLIIALALIAMVGTTTHYAFANNMGGPSVQPLCSTDTGGGMNMAPNTSDQGSGGWVAPSSPSTGPFNMPRVQPQYPSDTESGGSGPDTTQSNTADASGWMDASGGWHHHHAVYNPGGITPGYRDFYHHHRAHWGIWANENDPSDWMDYNGVTHTHH